MGIVNTSNEYHLLTEAGVDNHWKIATSWL